MGRGRTERVLVHRYGGDGDGDGDGVLHRAPDELVVEEPLEIRLDGHLVSTTMRTPGHDFELAAGFCHAEGLLDGATVRTCRYCGTGGAVETAFNVVSVDTGGRAPVPTPRLQTTTSACGMCGSTAIHDLRERLHRLPATEPWPLDLLATLPDRVGDAQPLFGRTGGVHAAAACDRSGEPLVVREDIGRHNAVDKVVGRLLLDGALPASDLALYASGRASFEIVQKAWAAGMSAVVAVSAPSALAVAAADIAGITLCGFARGGRMNVYAGLSVR
jgi:FdhD protein